METSERQIIGTEIEFSIGDQYSNVDFSNFVRYLDDDYKQICVGGRIHLKNGGKIYKDDDVLEICTPESLGAVQATYTELASEQIILDTIEAIKNRTSYFYNDDNNNNLKLSFYKRVIDYQLNSCGYHNNYSISKNLFNKMMDKDKLTPQLRFLVSFILSRTIFNGSGYLDIYNDQSYKILPSQKLQTLGKLIDQVTTISNNKPLINFRDNAYASKSSRFHDVSSDSNISLWAIWFNKASTSLVLRYLEHFNPSFSLKNDTLAIKAAKENIDPDLISSNHKKIKLIDISEIILEECRALSEKMDLLDEDKLVINEWQKAIDDYRSNKELLIDRVDWIRKDFILKLALENKKIKNTNDLKMIDLNYSNLSGKKSISNREKNIFPGYDPNEVKKYTLAPPKETRASLRVKLINDLLKNNIDIEDIDWSEIICNSYSGKYKYNIKEPKETSIFERQKIIKKNEIKSLNF